MDLDGRVALVSGASRGIGSAIAGRLAEAGVDVAAGYANDRAAAEEQTARISRMGRRAMAVRSDVSDPAAVEEMVDKVEAELGSVLDSAEGLSRGGVPHTEYVGGVGRNLS